MLIEQFNHLNLPEATAELMNCCTASRWVAEVESGRPYIDAAALYYCAENSWQKMSEPDWLEAFDGHPKIGDPDSLRKKFSGSLHLASNEQSGMRTADDETITQLAEANSRYEAQNGFIYIVCATGKSATEMLQSIIERLENTRQIELEIAAAEQWKITVIRLNKLFDLSS